MNGKRGRCALCTINKEEIKIMKQFKKLASLLLAAVLAMTLLAGCGGRGGNVGTAVTEQSILKHINEYRKKANTGLSPVENDSTLANAAAKLLEAYSETEMVKTYYGTGYKLTKEQVKSILNTATGRNDQEVLALAKTPADMDAVFVLPPVSAPSIGMEIFICSAVATKSSILWTTVTAAHSVTLARLGLFWQVT